MDFFFQILRGTKLAQFGALSKKELIQEGIRKHIRQSVQVRAPVEGDNRRKKKFFFVRHILRVLILIHSVNFNYTLIPICEPNHAITCAEFGAQKKPEAGKNYTTLLMMDR